MKQIDYRDPLTTVVGAIGGLMLLPIPDEVVVALFNWFLTAPPMQLLRGTVGICVMIVGFLCYRRRATKIHYVLPEETKP